MDEGEGEKEEIKYKLAQDLGDEFLASVVKIEKKPDFTGAECLFFWLEGEGYYTIVKYRVSHQLYLERIMRRMGFKSPEELVGKKFKWKKYSTGKGYPRPYPIELIP